MLMILSLLMYYQEKISSIFIVRKDCPYGPTDPSVPLALIKSSWNHLALALISSSSKAGHGLQLHVLVTDK